MSSSDFYDDLPDATVISAMAKSLILWKEVIDRAAKAGEGDNDKGALKSLLQSIKGFEEKTSNLTAGEGQQELNSLCDKGRSAFPHRNGRPTVPRIHLPRTPGEQFGPCSWKLFVEDSPERKKADVDWEKKLASDRARPRSSSTLRPRSIGKRALPPLLPAPTHTPLQEEVELTAPSQLFSAEASDPVHTAITSVAPPASLAPTGGTSGSVQLASDVTTKKLPWFSKPEAYLDGLTASLSHQHAAASPSATTDGVWEEEDESKRVVESQVQQMMDHIFGSDHSH